MSGVADYHHRGTIIGAKIYDLLHSLGPSTYDEISPKIEYWIEYALTEQSVDANDLVERLSSVAWDYGGSGAVVARFLKEFRDHLTVLSKPNPSSTSCALAFFDGSQQLQQRISRTSARSG